MAIIQGRSGTKASDLLALVDGSAATIKRDLSYLFEKELIVREGNGKGTIYKALDSRSLLK